MPPNLMTRTRPANSCIHGRASMSVSTLEVAFSYKSGVVMLPLSGRSETVGLFRHPRRECCAWSGGALLVRTSRRCSRARSHASGRW
ncbi:hypothetical protein ACFPRL_05740 [Pseudoclavibacter helvolus]